MSSINSPKNVKELPKAVIKNMIFLSTSGFGVVVALAWNELIKQFVTDYIDPIFGKNSGIVSLLIYAVAVTLLAILVTMQLSALEKRLESPKQAKKRAAKKS